MGIARETAERYVEMARADAKAGLADLFARDATFNAPDGNRYVGRAEIAAFYGRHLAAIVPEFHIQRLVDDGDAMCWIELANGSLAAPLLLATNHFTVGSDGLIMDLTVFLRPQQPAA